MHKVHLKIPYTKKVNIPKLYRSFLGGKYTGAQEKAELAWNLIHVPKENCELLNAQNTDMLNI